MAYPATLADMRNIVLDLLNESSNTTAGDLRSGTGAASTLTTSATLNLLLNEACADFSRYAYGLQDTATYSAFPANTIYASFTASALSPTTYYRLWAARTVSYAGKKLDNCSRSHLELSGINFSGNFPNDAAGTPLYWFDDANEGIGIYPPSSTSSSSLVVSGLALPVQLVNDTDVTPFQADENKIICYYAAARIAQKNLEDPSLAARADIWAQEWNVYKDRYVERQWALDPAFAARHFPRPQAPSAPSPGTPKASVDMGV